MGNQRNETVVEPLNRHHPVTTHQEPVGFISTHHLGGQHQFSPLVY
ncbi:MAG: hypothetical protein IPP23_03320 [Sphingomonadales bacterium]|nr:hypothetical protein [Sphingomonadales bacterium]